MVKFIVQEQKQDWGAIEVGRRGKSKRKKRKGLEMSRKSRGGEDEGGEKRMGRGGG